MLIRFAIFLAVCAFCSAEELPSFVKKCKFEDLDCILESANDIIINHASEINQLKFKYFDPWVQGDFQAGEEESRPIQLNMHLSNSEIYGMRGMRFNKAVGWKKEIPGSKFELFGSNSYLNFTGNYNVDGRILLLPIQGNGVYNMLLEDINFGLKLKVDEFKKDGKRYIKVKKVKLLLEPVKFHINMSNLFDGNEELSKSLLDVINQNWKEAWNEIAPSLFEINENIIKNVLQDFFDAFSYDDLFLSDS